MASGTRTCSLIISPSPVTIAMTPHVQKSAPAAQCISVKMALWWLMKMFVSAAATATWLVRTVRALEFGPIEELRQKHGTLAAVAPLPRAHFTKPNIVIKPNANSRPTGDTTGYLANPEEV